MIEVTFQMKRERTDFSINAIGIIHRNKFQVDQITIFKIMKELEESMPKYHHKLGG